MTETPAASRTRTAGAAGAAGERRVPDLTGGLATLRGLLDRPLASYHLLLSSSALLLVIGLVMVFSATSVEAFRETGDAYSSISNQAMYAIVGLFAFWICQRLPARTYRSLGRPLLVASLILLVLLDLLGVLARLHVIGAPRLGPLQADDLWLHVGPLQLQPSELVKFALVLWGADVLARKGPAVADWRQLSVPLFTVGGLVLVLVGYSDLGTMLILLVLFVGLLWAAGVRLRVFATMGLVALIGILMLTMINSERSGRLSAFLDPNGCDANDACYQLVQGFKAIARGGWFGVGLGKGSLKWGWLPSGHNDFIFAVVGEELGVVGCLVILALLAVLTYTGLRIARRVYDPFRRLAAAAVIAWLVGQATINIGGVVGLLPITGLPLPFISDGGSALVVVLAAVGMLASFARAEPDAARALHARPPARWVRLVWAPLPSLPPPPRQAERGYDRSGSARPASRRDPEQPANGRGRR